METAHHRRIYSVAAWSIVALAIAVAGLVLLLPPPSFSDPTFLRPRTALGLMAAILMIGTGGLLLVALQHFKRKLRIAYALVAIGIGLYGITLAQLPIIGFFNIWDSWYASSGVFVIPFIFAAGSIYAGVRRFGKLLGVRSVFSSFTLAISVGLIVAILSYVAAKQWATHQDIDGNNLYIAIVGWSTCYSVCATILLRRIVARIGPFYHDALRRLYIAVAAIALTGLHEYITSYPYSNPDWYVSHGISTLPLVATGLICVWAAHGLCGLNTVQAEQAEETIGEPVPATDAEYTDAITYAASLSSHPNDIDFILDDLRLVTSNLTADQALSPDDKRRLINVYLKVELYLLYHDPMRNFSREEIRSKLSPGMQAVIAKQTPPDEKKTAPDNADAATTPA